MGIEYEDNLTVGSAGAMVMQYPIAGLGSRAYAFIIDIHIRFILATAWWLLFYFIIKLMGDSLTSNTVLGKSLLYTSMIGSSLIYFLYHPVLEIMMKGRTPGKRFAGIRIVTLDGSVPSIPAILVRNVFRILDSLPFIYIVGIGACLLTRKQVRIGDLAAHTVLVHEDVMQDKAIELMSQAANESSLAPAQIEVLHDLLQRWKQLNRESRIRVGQKLLQAAGTPVEPDNSASRLDKKVHDALQMLSRGD
ncbi:MAG: RDD family protein [Acidiferrobacterales bacterium]